MSNSTSSVLEAVSIASAFRTNLPRKRRPGYSFKANSAVTPATAEREYTSGNIHEHAVACRLRQGGDSSLP